jgi:hypothetical protein
MVFNNFCVKGNGDKGKGHKGNGEKGNGEKGNGDKGNGDKGNGDNCKESDRLGSGTGFIGTPDNVLGCVDMEATFHNISWRDKSKSQEGETVLKENTSDFDFDQETHDALFEAGYSIDEINEIVASKSLHTDTTNLGSINVDRTLDSDELHGDESDSEKENENANDIQVNVPQMNMVPQMNKSTSELK